MEKDPEISNGNYTTHFRALDTRIGRWLSVDPKANLMAPESPYNFSSNSPLIFNDPRGDLIPPLLIAYAIGVGVGFAAQWGVHTIFSGGNPIEGLKKIDFTDVIIMAIPVPGSPAVVALGTTAKSAASSVVDITADRGVQITGLNKTWTSTVIDGTFNLIGGGSSASIMNAESKLLKENVESYTKGLAEKAPKMLEEGIVKEIKGADGEVTLSIVGKLTDVAKHQDPEMLIRTASAAQKKIGNKQLSNALNGKAVNENLTPLAIDTYFTKVFGASLTGTASATGKTVGKTAEKALTPSNPSPMGYNWGGGSSSGKQLATDKTSSVQGVY